MDQLTNRASYVIGVSSNVSSFSLCSDTLLIVKIREDTNAQVRNDKNSLDMRAFVVLSVNGVAVS